MTITIYLQYGKDIWSPNEYSDYKLQDDMFIVLREGQWVGFYPLRNVYKIIVK